MSIRRVATFSLSSIIVFSLSIFSGYSQQMPKMYMDTSVIKQKDMKDTQNMKILPMPFFTHMGIPFDVGTYNLRVAAVPT
jgi:hypothetical protein